MGDALALPVPDAWRCIIQPCADCRCTPPPEADDISRCCLAGASAEKALRKALLMTPEWTNLATRKATARIAELRGDHQLASILHAREATALRKRHMIELCRAWRYRSGVWLMRAPRGSATTAAAAAAAPGELALAEPLMSPAGLALDPTRTVSLLHDTSVPAFIAGTLVPLRDEMLQFAYGQSGMLRASATGGSGFVACEQSQLESLQEGLAQFAMMDELMGRVGAHVDTLRAQLAPAAWDGDRALQAMQGRSSGLEELLDGLCALSVVSVAENVAKIERLQAALGAATPALDVAYFGDVNSYVRLCQRMTVLVRGALGALQFGDVTLYLLGAAAFVDFFRDVVRRLRDALEHRTAALLPHCRRADAHAAAGPNAYANAVLSRFLVVSRSFVTIDAAAAALTRAAAEAAARSGGGTTAAALMQRGAALALAPLNGRSAGGLAPLPFAPPPPPAHGITSDAAGAPLEQVRRETEERTATVASAVCGSWCVMLKSGSLGSSVATVSAATATGFSASAEGGDAFASFGTAAWRGADGGSAPAAPAAWPGSRGFGAAPGDEELLISGALPESLSQGDFDELVDAFGLS